nr:MAG TPA: hypothetical protein [Caudoviricetes sp.]
MFFFYIYLYLFLYIRFSLCITYGFCFSKPMVFQLITNG